MRQYMKFITEALPPKAAVPECRAASDDARARLIGNGSCLGQRDTSQPLLKQGRTHRPGSGRAGTHYNERKEVSWPAFA